MSDTDNNLAIVLITRSRLEIFDLGQKKVFPFNLTINLFKDLEIVNKNELDTQMSLFINFYKIKPVPIVILLSSEICFDLEISETNETSIERKINNFLNYLPFEESIHKIYKLTKGFYLSAVNKEIVDTFRNIFKKQGFFTEAIVPAAIAGINIKNIDAPSADFILAKLSFIKNHSLVNPEVVNKEQNTPEVKVMGVNRIFVLLSIFLLLLLALLFVLYRQTMSNRKVSKTSYNLTTFITHSSVKIDTNLPAFA